MMPPFDHSDYSVVVKRKAPLPNPWRWEIYRAGRAGAVEHSKVSFETVGSANRAGKEALRQLLDELGFGPTKVTPTRQYKVLP